MFFCIFEIMFIWILGWIIYTQKFLDFSFILKFRNIVIFFLIPTKNANFAKIKKCQHKIVIFQLFLLKLLIHVVFFLILKKKEVKHLNASKTNFIACHPQTFINKHKRKKKKMSGYCLSKNSYLLMHKLILRSGQKLPFGNVLKKKCCFF